MRLIDSHAHLEQVKDLETALERAKAAGVIGVVAVGMGEESNEAILKIGSDHPDFVFPCVGLHPWNLRDEVEPMLKFLEKKIERCTAVGEVGLDFKISKPRDLQVRAFRGVLELATRFEKPLIVHSRWAWREAFDMVREAGARRTVFHWYSGPLETLREILSFGCYVSATPAVAYSEPHRLALAEVPIDRLLLETDSPVKYRGRESSPVDVIGTLKAMSRIKGVDGDELAEATTENAIKFFGLEPYLT
jgi:TatD DNase family protein